MKSLIGNIKLKNKITLLVGLPVLGLIIFASLMIMRSLELYRSSSAFSDLVDMVLVGGEVIDAIQNERDMSVMYIVSEENKMSQQLATQQKLTDEKIREFQEHVEAIDRSNFSPKLRQSIDDVLAQVRGVSSMRSQISGRTVSLDAIMPFYREVVESLMNLDNEFVILSPNGDIAQVASAFSAFSGLKEMASRERAELTFAFARDGFRPGMHIKILNLMNEEQNLTSDFEHLSTPAQAEMFRSKMQHPAIHELGGLRDTAIERAGGKLGINPAQWYRLASEKQEMLNSIEASLASDIHVIVDGLLHGTGRSLLIAIVGIVLMLLATFFLGMMISRSIIGPVKTAVDVAELIASGDLRLSNISGVKHSDEVGTLLQALQSMQEKLTKVIRSSKEAASVVKKGAEEIRVGNSNLSERTDQQAANLQETTSSMEEMAGTVRQNADNAKQANQLAKAAREQAEKGGEVVGRAVFAMNKINDSSKKIADIISVIDEIAFQTNLLALNAAVEAARAGEQGRGFAVVASEVRNLAGRSATAAKEIKGLIGDSVEKVTEGSKLVNDSGQLLTEIVSSVKKVSDIIAEIASAGQEQSTGIDQVSLAVSQMDELTQQNSAMVQESAKASETMGSQANSLRDILEFFKIDNDVEMATDHHPAQVTNSNVVQHLPKVKSGSSKSSVTKTASVPKSVPKVIPKAATGSAQEWESF